VNVKDFGAVGDGVTDDTAAIQAALDTGKRVILPKSSSNYKVTALIISLSNTHFIGQGGTLEQIAGTSGHILSVGDSSLSVITSNVVVDGIKIYGNKNQQQLGDLNFAIACYKLIEAKLTNCNVTDAKQSSLHIAHCDRFHVSGNRFETAGVSGGGGRNEVTIQYSNRCLFTANILDGSGYKPDNVGCLLNQSNYCVIDSNQFTNYASENIQIQNYSAGESYVSTNRPTGNVISNNVFTYTTSGSNSGVIHVGYNADFTTISNNKLYAGGTANGSGIKIAGWSSNVNVSNNTIEGGLGNGINIQFYNEGKINITGNLISSCGRNGIYIAGNLNNNVSNVSISDNHIYNNGQTQGTWSGVKIESYCDDVRITNNLIKDTQTSPTQSYGFSDTNGGVYQNISIIGNDVGGHLLGNGNFNTNKVHFIMYDNKEADYKDFYTLTGTWSSLQPNSVSTVITAPSAAYADYDFDVELNLTEIGATNGAVSIGRGKYSGNITYFMAYNIHPIQASSGTMYIYRKK